MLEEVYAHDREFTEDKFKTYVDNVFIQVHLAIITKELYKIEHFVSKDIYEKLSKKVDDLREKKQIQMYDEMNVKQTTIREVKVVEDKMLIGVQIISRYMDYLLDEDGHFISGNNQSRIEKENNLTFMKKIDATGLDENRKCPTCGASMDINSNGRCAFCGTVFNLNEKSWVLVEFEVK